MDSALSTHLPAAGLATNKPFTDSLLDLKARSLGSDFDDNSSVMSGSVTSLTSAGKAVVCAECKQPEDQPSKPFVRCPKCRKIWHQCCLERLNPDCPKIPDPDWACGSCRLHMEASKVSDKKRRYRSSTSKPKGTPSKPVSGRVTGPASPAEQVLEKSLAHDAIESEDLLLNGLAAQDKSSKQKVCRVPGCNKVLFSLTPSIDTLCQTHKIEQRFADSKAAGKAQASVPAPAPKPINRNRLYHARPADKEVIKLKEALKRKRAGNTTSDPASGIGDMDPRSSGTLKPGNSLSGVSYTSVSTRRPSMEESRQTNRPKLSASKQGNAATSSAGQPQHSSKLPRQISASKVLQTLPSPRSDTGMIEDSPEYEPPPPQIPVSGNIWGLGEEVMGTSAAPRPERTPANGSIEAAETGKYSLPATETSNTDDNVHTSYDSLIDHLAGERAAETSQLRSETPSMPFPEAAVSPELSVVNPPDADTNMTDGLGGTDQPEVEDSPMTDIPSSDVQPNAEVLPLVQNPDPDVQPNACLSPTLDGPSPGGQLNNELAAMADVIKPDAQANTPDITGPNVDPEVALKALNNGWIVGDRPRTVLEEKLARDDFDEDAVDFLLARQSNRDYSSPPSIAQLEAQTWGHIDPKVYWPKEPFTEPQASAKIEEIEARGGRKANLGKIFTAQNLTEKAANGWEMHQCRDVKDDDETRESGKRLEILFGIEGLDNFVPSTKNGRLVMVEREPADDEPRGPGRRKKKNKLRMYPVFGIPNNV